MLLQTRLPSQTIAPLSPSQTPASPASSPASHAPIPVSPAQHHAAPAQTPASPAQTHALTSREKVERMRTIIVRVLERTIEYLVNIQANIEAAESVVELTQLGNGAKVIYLVWGRQRRSKNVNINLILGS